MHLYYCSMEMPNVSTDNLGQAKGITRQFVSEKMESLVKNFNITNNDTMLFLNYLNGNGFKCSLC